MMMKINRSKKMPVLCCSRCRSVVSIKKWVILEYLISNNDEIFCGDCEIACFIFDI